MEDTRRRRWGLAPEDDLYRRLMSQEERVLRTIDALAQERQREVARARDPWSRSASVLWMDMCLTLLALLRAGPRDMARRLWRDGETQMHLGLALVLAGMGTLVVFVLVAGGRGSL